MNRLVQLVAVALFSCMLTNAQEINKEKLDKLFSILEENNKMMGSVNVSRGGKTIYSNAIGYAYIKDSIKNSANTKYRIGSVTKLFTATMIFQLVDANKISLNDRLSDFFPSIKNSEKITIGNLMSHTSGLFSINSAEGFNPYEKQTHEQMLTKIAAFEPNFEPGTKVEYSNTNFIVLGYILEKVCGKPYSKVLKEQITTKLGLDNTYYGGKISVRNNEAASYDYANQWNVQRETEMSLPHGAGALVSNPKDLTHFIESLFDGKLMSDQSLKKMITLKDKGYGYGIFGEVIHGKMVYGGNGRIDGFNSVLVYNPENDIAISILANGNSQPIMLMAMNTLYACLNEPFELPNFNSFELEDGVLSNYAGLYKSSNAPFNMSIKIVDGKLFGGPEGNDNNFLRPVKQHQFSQDNLGVILDFDPVKAQMTMSQGDKKLLFDKQN